MKAQKSEIYCICSYHTLSACTHCISVSLTHICMDMSMHKTGNKLNDKWLHGVACVMLRIMLFTGGINTWNKEHIHIYIYLLVNNFSYWQGSKIKRENIVIIHSL